METGAKQLNTREHGTPTHLATEAFHGPHAIPLRLRKPLSRKLFRPIPTYSAGYPSSPFRDPASASASNANAPNYRHSSAFVSIRGTTFRASEQQYSGTHIVAGLGSQFV
jgi:hypothetical protein